jgi:hypothetical protein
MGYRLGPRNHQNVVSTTLVLEAIHKCNITLRNDLDMHYYQKDRPIKVVEILSVQCLVERIKTTDKKNWVIMTAVETWRASPGAQTLKYICNTVFFMFLVLLNI